MKKTITLFVFLFSVYFVSAQAQQSLCFDAGQVFSKFIFTGNSGSKTKDFDYHPGGSYSLDYHYVIRDGIFVRGGVGMRKAGATAMYEGIPLSWNLNYLDLQGGVGYAFIKFRFKPYLCAVPYFGYLLKAWQTIGSDNFDLKKDKTLSNQDFGVYVIPGVKVALSDHLAIYSEYKQMIGLANIEKTAGQKLNNRGFIFNLGVAASITKQ